MEDKKVVLSVKDLNVKFTLRGQILHAIRGISLDVYQGESLAIVGESGSGKSVFVKCAMGLLDANGYIDGGSILYNGMDLTKFQTDKDWLKIRGKEIAMVFQDPMTSLNPLKTIGKQIQEAVELHQGLKGGDAYKAVLEVLSDVGIDDPERRYKQYPHDAPAGGHRHCRRLPAEDPHLRRADHRSGRDHSGADPGADQGHAEKV